MCWEAATETLPWAGLVCFPLSSPMPCFSHLEATLPGTTLYPTCYKSYEYYKLIIFSEDIIHKPAKPRMWETTLFSIVIMIVSWLESLLHWSEAWLSHLSLWIWINLSPMVISQGLTPPSFSIFTQEFTCTIPYFTLWTCLNHYMENLSNPILNFCLKVFLKFFFLFSFFKL